tara:strand:+ start:400 stop:522 length:123 start_codon:yes stop_codon:yes gene_type:complete
MAERFYQALENGMLGEKYMLPDDFCAADLVDRPSIPPPEL